MFRWRTYNWHFSSLSWYRGRGRSSIYCTPAPPIEAPCRLRMQLFVHKPANRGCFLYVHKRVLDLTPTFSIA